MSETDIAVPEETDLEYTFPYEVVIKDEANNFWKGYWEGFAAGYKEHEEQFNESPYICGSLDDRIANAVRKNRRVYGQHQ